MVGSGPGHSTNLEHHVKDGVDEGEVNACQAKKELSAEQDDGPAECNTLLTIVSSPFHMD